MSKFKKIAVKGFTLLLDIESIVNLYLSKIRHALSRISHAMSAQIFCIQVSALSIGSLAGLYLLFRKKKSKSLVSKVTKATMFIASFSLTVLSVAMVAVVGVGNTGVFLLAAIIVDLSRMAFRYFHSRNKLKKLLNLKDKIDGKDLSQFSPEELKYLMKSDDVSMEYLQNNIDARIEKLQSKVQERKGACKISGFNLALTITIVVLTFIYPVAALGISIAALSIGGYQIYQISKSRHLQEVEDYISTEKLKTGVDDHHVDQDVKNNCKEGIHLIRSDEDLRYFFEHEKTEIKAPKCQACKKSIEKNHQKIKKRTPQSKEQAEESAELMTNKKTQ